MSLSFKPGRAVYDPNKGVLRFLAIDGALLVKCGVSRNALVALDDGSPRGPALLERVYERHQQRIQDIASRKHRAKQLETDGMILVGPQDLKN